MSYKIDAHLVSVALIILFQGCNSYSTQLEPIETLPTHDFLSQVSVQPLQQAPFELEVITNGKLIATERSDLKFAQALNITRICVKNGDRVRRGQLIAQLDSISAFNSIREAQDQLEKAKLEFRDILVKMGFDPGNIGSIPDDILQSAKTISNYNKAQIDLERQRQKFRELRLTSPVEGLICNLFTRENNLASTSEIFCTVIDDRFFEAEFPILENELNVIDPTISATISPIAFERYAVSGKITRINPLVDENGLITVHASISNRDRKLFEGMRVDVTLKKSFRDRLVVPKEAVVDRNGKSVVFTYLNHHAKWNYVETGPSNSKYTVISAGLATGETVIVRGNLTLSNGTKVEIAKE